jgi:hypothetical protein
LVSGFEKNGLSIFFSAPGALCFVFWISDQQTVPKRDDPIPVWLGNFHSPRRQLLSRANLPAIGGRSC